MATMWRLRQIRSRDDILTLGYFPSKRALLQYCKAQIGTDFPSLCDVPCDVVSIGPACDADGTLSCTHRGTVTFHGTWTDGNTHCIERVVPCWKS